MRPNVRIRTCGLLPMMFVVAGLGLQSQPAATAATQDCDCSCETFAQAQAAIQEQGGGGEAVDMHTFFATCYSQCTQQWSQCAQNAQGETDTKKWDCDKQPNSPVETREWARACDVDLVHRKFGEPRDDLGRFHGEYQDSWVVATTAASAHMAEIDDGIKPGDEVPGYMMIYNAKGDVAPYYLKSVADTRFEYRTFGGGNRIAEFELGSDGQATALLLNGERHARLPGGDARQERSDDRAHQSGRIGDDIADRAADQVERNIEDQVRDGIDDAFESIFGD